MALKLINIGEEETTAFNESPPFSRYASHIEDANWQYGLLNVHNNHLTRATHDRRLNNSYVVLASFYFLLPPFELFQNFTSCHFFCFPYFRFIFYL